MHTNQISITISIPTIGDNDFLSLAFESALSQIPDDGEIIISDNASNNSNYISSFAQKDPLGRVRIIQQDTRLPMAENWNRCLYAARGKYFLLLSDDDMIVPGFCHKTMAILEDPSVGFASCRVEWINEVGRCFWRTPSLLERETCLNVLLGVFLRKRVILPCATLIRRNDLLSVGGYDVNFGNFADIKAWIEIGSKYPLVGFINESLAMYRERPASLTKVVDDNAWRDCISKVIDFSCDYYPNHANKIRRVGRDFLEYMLSDIKIKRVLNSDINIAFAEIYVWEATKNLPVHQRFWLMAKLIYLRLTIAKPAKPQ